MMGTKWMKASEVLQLYGSTGCTWGWLGRQQNLFDLRLSLEIPGILVT
jgi:hypothetical protein